ncbi:MAG: SURF1 family cytochrome oxidase biogenesis protein, partial [Novosphingobium sp.]
MIRRLPIIPTVFVLAAVGVMIVLGFWQLDRRAQKEAMLARYAAAQT